MKKVGNNKLFTQKPCSTPGINDRYRSPLQQHFSSDSKGKGVYFVPPPSITSSLLIEMLKFKGTIEIEHIAEGTDGHDPGRSFYQLLGTEPPQLAPKRFFNPQF